MKFTIDVRIRHMGFFRFRKNKAFRKMSTRNHALQEGDWVGRSISEAYRQIDSIGSEISIGGQKIPTSAEDGRDDFELIADLSPNVHRSQRPLMPSRGQLAEVVRKADDSHNNFLLLDLDGRFVIRDQNTMGSFRHKDWAVCHEAFIAGNHYVGIKASEDITYIDGLYRDMLSGWLEHLSTGKINCFVSVAEDVNTSQLIAKIKHFGQRKPRLEINPDP